ncbi:MAG: putative DNA binding domain-containing protein [Ruminiclostridium sp.]|nr:putative DNA binding domain-containing protein [Ruminiclostridium sp.]
MDADRIRQLLRREENPKLDFKATMHLETEGEKKELTKDVIAIANSRGGRGYILFGVEDKSKKPLGIEPKYFNEEQIQQIIYNRSDPPVSVTVEFVEYEGVNIAVLTIFKSHHKPHQMLQTGAFYIRRGSTTDIARRSEIAQMMQENGLQTYETVPLLKAKMEDLDKELLQEYFSNLKVCDDTPNIFLMEALGFISEIDNGEYSPTIGGMLVFGKDPTLFLPQCYVKLISSEGITHITGNIYSMMHQSLELIRNIISDDTYPFDAVEESLANAMLHRDYLDIGRGILIEITDDFIEISNPGALVAGNITLKYMRDKNPQRRNPWLYQRLLILDYKRHFIKVGTGILSMKEAFADRGKVKFINLGSRNLFKVVFPR